MHLINCTTKTPRLEEVPENRIPHYVILSHTWGSSEVTFQDMQKIDSQDLREMQVEGRQFSYPSPAKYQKLVNSCIWAFRCGYKYLWIDTCCIDKSSSAELQEAINSMYRWYQDSQICIAYLEDVENGQWFDTHKSRWFTRGWTLQELLAPRNLVFLTKYWAELGTKAKLGKRLSDLTSIDLEILERRRPLRSVSLAQRMSWAVGRQTTRAEDRAYSLLGIFDVNMPMLYGEGEKAFFRLQEEILKSTYDQSLLAWYGSPSKFGVLADSPDKFACRSKYVTQSQILPRAVTEPTFLTNKGLRIELICWRGGPLSSKSGQSCGHQGRWLAVLECTWTDDKSHPVIILEEVEGTDDQFKRVETTALQAEGESCVNEHKGEMLLTYDTYAYGKNCSNRQLH
jgi:hypothetical protein